MISKSTNYLTSLMLKTGTIQPEEVEIYNYLLKWLFENITYFIFFVICGLVFGNILYGLILYSVIAPLRSFGGGVHAPTKLLCDILWYGGCSNRSCTNNSRIHTHDHMDDYILYFSSRDHTPCPCRLSQ